MGELTRSGGALSAFGTRKRITGWAKGDVRTFGVPSSWCYHPFVVALLACLWIQLPLMSARAASEGDPNDPEVQNWVHTVQASIRDYTRVEELPRTAMQISLDHSRSFSRDPKMDLAYDPVSGFFYVLHGQSVQGTPVLWRPLRSLGPIPGLTAKEVDARSLATSTDPRRVGTDLELVALRHGPWITVVDVQRDSIWATNIGPVVDFTSRGLDASGGLGALSWDDPEDLALVRSGTIPAVPVVYFTAKVYRPVSSARKTRTRHDELKTALFLVSPKGKHFFKILGEGELPQKEKFQVHYQDKPHQLFGERTQGVKVITPDTVLEYREKWQRPPLEAGKPDRVVEVQYLTSIETGHHRRRVNSQGAEGESEESDTTVILDSSEKGGDQFLSASLDSFSLRSGPQMDLSRLDRAACLRGQEAEIRARAKDGVYLSVRELSGQNLQNFREASRPYRFAGAVVRQRVEAAQRTAERLRQGLEEKITGQKEAVEQIVSALARDRTQGGAQVLYFGGPTGVGKSVTATLIHKLMEYEGEPFVFNLGNEQSTVTATAKLFGGTTTYVGYDHGGSLAEYLLTHEEAVLFFDEADKTKPEVLELLLPVLSSRKITLNSHAAEKWAKHYKERKTPVTQWAKAIREATKDGTAPAVEVQMELGPYVDIIFAGNVGASAYTGQSGTSVSARRLSDELSLRTAQGRVDEAYMKAELLSAGVSDQFISRITRFIPFSILLKSSFQEILQGEWNQWIASINARYLVQVSVPASVREFYLNVLFDPLQGVRGLSEDLQRWVFGHIEQLISLKLIVQRGTVELEVVNPGPGQQPRLNIISTSGGRRFVVESYDAGPKVKAPPTEQLARVRSHVAPALARELVGHEEQRQQILSQLTGALQKAVDHPDRKSDIISIFLDGPPGVGKTEIGRILARSLFDDPEAVLKVGMESVQNLDDFENKFLVPLRAAAQANPDVLVLVLDELPRMGRGLENLFFQILQDGEIPSANHEHRAGRGQLIQRVHRQLHLPKRTLILSTGNLFLSTMGSTVGITQKYLMAHAKYLQRHPQELQRQYEERWPDAAFRRRLGPLIMMMPLSMDHIVELRTRAFAQIRSSYQALGLADLEMGASFDQWFRREYAPMEGGGWVGRVMRENVDFPLSDVSGRLRSQWTGRRGMVEFDSVRREVVLELSDGAGTKERVVLSRIPPIQGAIHPDVLTRMNHSIVVHEIGHVITALASYGLGSVADVMAFGGPHGGGVTHMKADGPTYSPYNTLRAGIQRIAISLGGHAAEILYEQHGPVDGAGSDFGHANELALRMIQKGSLMELAPLPGVYDQQSGRMIYSPAVQARLELEQTRLLHQGGLLSRWILEKNKVVFKKLVEALESSEDLILEGDEIDRLVKAHGGLTSPSDANWQNEIVEPCEKALEKIK